MAFIITPAIIFLTLFIDFIKIKLDVNRLYSGKYGSLFSEFHTDKDFIHILYYPMLTMRSLAFAISQICFNENEYLQRIFNLVVSSLLTIYIITCRPFKEKTTLITNIFIEVLTCFLFWIILFRSFWGFFQVDDNLNFCFILAVLLQIGFHYLVSIYSLIAKIIYKCRRMRKTAIEIPNRSF